MNIYFHSAIKKVNRKDFSSKLLNNCISIGHLLELPVITISENKDDRDEI